MIFRASLLAEPTPAGSIAPERPGDRPGGAHGVRLTHEKLAALHPADVAELVAQLSAPDRAAVLESLEPEAAA